MLERGMSSFLCVLFSRLLPPTSTFDASPAASPLWSFGTGATLPNPVWQCFQMGVRIKFLIPNADAPWQKAEELAWKDQVAMKIDARNTYQYAPHGLVLVQVNLIIFQYKGDLCNDIFLIFLAV